MNVLFWIAAAGVLYFLYRKFKEMLKGSPESEEKGGGAHPDLPSKPSDPAKK